LTRPSRLPAARSAARVAARVVACVAVRLVVRVALPVVLFGGAACVVPGEDRADAGLAVDDRVPECRDATCDRFAVEYVVGTWARAICAFPFGCCSVADRVDLLQLVLPAPQLQQLQLQEPGLFNDEDACTRALAVALAAGLQDDVLAFVDGRRVYGREQAAQCVAPLDVALGACAVDGYVGTLLRMGEVLAGRAPGDVCAGLFAGTAGAGGACRDDGDCVVDGTGLRCETPSQLAEDGSVALAFAGTCSPPRAAGEGCAVLDDVCAAGLFCAPAIPGLTTTPSCVPRAALGASCAAAPCVEEATCDVATALCVPRRPTGAPCEDDGACEGDRCVDGRCGLPPTATTVRLQACVAAEGG
jgi:hypothetical protein